MVDTNEEREDDGTVTDTSKPLKHAMKLGETPETGPIIKGIDDAELKNLIDKYGDLWFIGAGETLIIFKRPSRPAFTRFQTRVAANHSVTTESEILCAECAVYPDRKGLEKLLNKYPARAGHVATDACNVAGDEETKRAKKVPDFETARTKT